MDKFDIAEIEGRNNVYGLISGHCRNYEFSDKKFSNVDLFITGTTGRKAVMEIKNRTAYTSTEIDKIGGHILEWNKYTGLTSYDGYIPIYTICYPDRLLMWDVSKITEERFQIEENKYPKETYGNKARIPKKVAYLKSDECCTVIERKKNN